MAGVGAVGRKGPSGDPEPWLFGSFVLGAVEFYVESDGRRVSGVRKTPGATAGNR